MGFRNTRIARFGATLIGLSLLAGATALVRPAYASDLSWSASVATGAPAIEFDGTAKMQTVLTNHGLGIRHQNGKSGLASVVIPVSPPAGSGFSTIYLRAEDNS